MKTRFIQIENDYGVVEQYRLVAYWRKDNLEWRPDPAFKDGSVWEVWSGDTRQHNLWVARSSSRGFQGSIGLCQYTDEVSTMQQAAKLVLKAYHERQ